MNMQKAFNFAVGILQFAASCGPVSVDYTYLRFTLFLASLLADVVLSDGSWWPFVYLWCCL